MEIILTVQSCNFNKFRFGINAKDSKEIFKERGMEITLTIEKTSFVTKTKCGPINFNFVKGKKSYDLYDVRIDRWIKEIGFDSYNENNFRSPKKLLFDYNQIKRKLTFIREIN